MSRPISMPNLLAVLLLVAGASASSVAGAASQEGVIRDLEQQQAKLALAGDRPALEKLFAPEFRVINPAGAIATKAELLDILSGTGPSPYRSATYETHDVTVRGDMAWSVGLETVVFARDALGSRAGQSVQRRITHVWEKQAGQWRLVLRHATNLVPSN
jgi:ketosteroid isomerase-like protein